MYNLKTRIIVSMTFLMLMTHHLFPAGKPSDDFNIRNHSVMLPKKYQFKEFNWMLGVGFAKLPFDWVETAINAPLFYVHANYGLPFGLQLKGEIQTLIVSNQFKLGVKWGHEFGRFSVGAGIGETFMFGKMGFLGFDNKVTGWTTTPNVSVGYNFGKICLSATAEFPILTHMSRSAGEVSTNIYKNVFAGPSVNLFIEQRLYKEHTLIVGLKNNYTKYFFPAWMAFTTFNKRYYVPEIFFGFKI